MKILCCIYTDMYYDHSMRSLEYYTFWPACQKLGDAFLFQLDQPGIANTALQASLLNIIDLFKPDVIFACPVKDEIPHLANLPIPSVGWICDSYRQDWLPGELRKYTHIVGTDPRTEGFARQIPKPYMATTWACNPDFHQPAKLKNLDIVWIGQNSAWRRDYVDALKKEFGDRFIARGWHFPGGPVTWPEYINLLGRAKIGLSLSLDMAGLPHGKLRPFEVAACGGMVLSQSPNTLDGYLIRDMDYIGFSSSGEMVERAGYYLTHDEEREKIAKSGRESVLHQSTFEIRLREVFEWATNQTFTGG